MAEKCRERKTVVFLPLIRMAKRFAELLNEYGISAAEVNGESPDREEILSDFEAGKYQALCNAMLLTEGWDCPSVDCVVVLRPTKVRSLYQQMVGRGTRLYPGKEDLLILDFLYLTAKHDLCTPASLFSGTAEVENRMEKMLRSGEELDVSDVEEQAERDVMAERAATLARLLEKSSRKKAKTVDPLEYALSIAAEDIALYEPTFGWEYDEPTPKQLRYLSKCGIATDAVYTKGLACVLIDKLIRRQNAELSTPKQIRLLQQYGYEDAPSWSFEKASHMISKILR
jgi:superfamily II DNA or RNA helicase